MKTTLALIALLGLSSVALADAPADCKAAAGSYLTGQVVSNPVFKGGSKRKGKELSHTHLSLRADQDGKTYDVAMDNVFASGYDQAGESVPAPLSSIKKGDHLQLCGQLYTSGVGIHWVHTNCGDTPNPAQPNGWVKKINADNSTGPNLEGSTEYCKLWPKS